MANVLFRKVLANKDVTEMPFAILADNFNSAPVCIGMSLHGTGDLVVERRPSAIAVEFVFRLVQLRIALAADVSSGRFVVRKLADARVLCPLVQNDVLLELS